MAKVKVITAQKAIERYKYYKEEIIRIQQAQVELKEKLKAKNEEIESLKKKLEEEFPALLKKYKAQRKLMQQHWIMNYLEGEWIMNDNNYCRNSDFFKGMISELTIYLRDSKATERILKALKYTSDTDYVKGQEFIYKLLTDHGLI